MAKLDQTTQLDITNKMSLGVLSSTNDRNYFEESFEWAPQVTSSDVYSEEVPAASSPAEADANVASYPARIQKLTDYALDEIPGSNGQGYSAYASPGNTATARLRDWLSPQKFGNGYAFSLKEQDATPISLTDGAFQVDYKNGIVRFAPNFRPADLSWTLPLKLTAYKYIGNKVSDGAASTTNLVVTQAGHGFVVGDYIRPTSTANVWTKAQANVVANFATHMVVAITSSSVFECNSTGTFTVPSHGFTIGDRRYLSATISGLSTDTAPALEQYLATPIDDDILVLCIGQEGTSTAGSGDIFVVEPFTLTAPVTTQFTLSQTPNATSKVILMGNGISYTERKGHITVVGQLVTWQGLSFPFFDLQDEVVVTYTV